MRSRSEIRMFSLFVIPDMMIICVVVFFQEGDMPLKDLLAMYGYGDPSTENSNSSDRLLIPSGSGDPEVEGQ